MLRENYNWEELRLQNQPRTCARLRLGNNVLHSVTGQGSLVYWLRAPKARNLLTIKRGCGTGSSGAAPGY
jgi:hypothetical protein